MAPMDCGCNKKRKCPDCGLKECNSPVTECPRLVPVQDKPLSIGFHAPCGDSELDLTKIIKDGETNTKLELNGTTYTDEDRSINYYPELWISSGGREGCINEITIPCIEKLMQLQEIGNVDASNVKSGDTLVWNSTTNKWEVYPVKDKIDDLNDRLTKIENAIYDWPSDPNSKIPRGNINLFSGGMGSNQWIRTRDGVNNGDLNQS